MIVRDELDAAVPTCADCGHRLEPAGTDAHPYWKCGACGLLTLSA